MHYCLRVPEIVEIICNHALHDAPWRTSKKSLTVLARTCRGFYEPAVSAIWHTLQNFEPIIKCLGRDVWLKRGPNETFGLVRALTQSDFAILKKYLHRVRVLWIREGGEYREVEAGVYEVLNILLGSESLFQNLHTFHLKLSSEPRACFLPFLHLLMGPRLSHFDLERRPPIFEVRSLPLQTFLLNLSFRHPHLTNVKIQGFGQASKAIADTAHNWAELKALHLDILDLPALRRLATLPSLQELDFVIRFPNHPIGVQSLFSGFPDSPFPSLRELAITSDGLVHCNHFFRLLETGVPLHKIEVVTIYDEPNVIEYADLVENIAGRVMPDTLTWLRINVGSLSSDDIQNHSFLPFNFSALKPLRKFRSLTFMNISSPGGWDITDEEMDTLCFALPNLRYCHLFNTPGVLQTYTMSLRVLLSFALHCQKLENFTIALDARMNRFPNVDPMPKQYSLMYLNVWDSPIDSGSSVPIARLIYNTFPYLSEVAIDVDKTHEGDSDPIVTGMGLFWREVDALMLGWHEEEELKGYSTVHS